ncbi:4-alpha-glucanotransferase [Candidatus Woesearchaeota archaeon]|nr:4-alpha-glucanotransferase [Candidatus Woesearchaeota archaeon]
MKILMLGWEFPPYKTGGLGTACYGLTKGMSKEGVDITFVVPFDPGKGEFVNLKGMTKTKVERIPSLLTPYQTSAGYDACMNDQGAQEVYGWNLFAEVERYSQLAAGFADDSFDIIHAHDWMTYKAGILAREITKKPLVVHIHATEYDRTGGHPNEEIAKRESEGMHAADLVIANSQRLKDEVIKHYGIDAAKIEVVHWGLDTDDKSIPQRAGWNQPTVLFLGRMTIQKGPEYFVHAAQKVLSHNPNVQFVMVGSGDKLPDVINLAADLGISDKILFTGALRGEDVNRAFSMADLFVMPSVSEPFGLVALEAMHNGTPAIISKQSGVSEVMRHCMQADFWDVDKMANLIATSLQHTAVLDELKHNGKKEIKRFDLATPAKKVINAYGKVLL